MPKHYFECDHAKVNQIKPRLYIKASNITDFNHIIASPFTASGNERKGLWYTDKRRKKAYKDCEDVKSVRILRVPMAFDTETTTVLEYGPKGELVEARGHLYIWQFMVGDVFVWGRTIPELVTFLTGLREHLQLGVHYNFNRKTQAYYTTMHEANIWVANLGFEFQFIRKHITVTDMFAKKKNSPVKFGTSLNFTFQDALAITNSSLAKIPKLYGLPTQKAVGDLDYKKMRNSQTPLTAQEWKYVINDVVVLAEFSEYLDKTYVENDVPIPMTATGILRDSVKKYADEFFMCACTSRKNRYYDVSKVMHMVDMLPPTYREFHEMEMFLFRGGYTHANALHCDEIATDVNGADFTSSYPAVCLQKKFPMSKFIKSTTTPTIDDIIRASEVPVFDPIRNYAVTYATKGWFRFHGLRAKTSESIESVSKLYEYSLCNNNSIATCRMCNIIEDNGRIRYADVATVMLTDVDLKIYKEFYEWDYVDIANVEFAEYAPLPSYVKDPMIYYYNKKNDLKKQGLDKTTEYGRSKAMVNAGYGMMCEHIHIDDIFYDSETNLWGDANESFDTWTDHQKELFYEENYLGNFSKYQKGLCMPKQILSPYWGVWVTAHARYNLLVPGVSKIGDDVLYCDTDSIYMINPDKHQDVLDAYNQNIYNTNTAWVTEENKRRTQLNRSDLPVIDLNNFIDLGEFDKLNKHGNYDKFKTLGAKRYLKQSGSEFEQTVAGLPKKAMEKYCGKYNLDPFKTFSHGMNIPAEFAGKNGHNYVNEARQDLITDEFGNSEVMHSESSIGIFPIEFTMTLTPEFLELIQAEAESRKAYERR